MPGKEGRHTAGLDSADKLDTARKAYEKSDKGKATKARYRETEGGKQVQRRYEDSYKFRLVQKKYYHSKKGQDRIRTVSLNKKTFRKAANWLREHPGKTLKDYLETLPSQEATEEKNGTME